MTKLHIRLLGGFSVELGNHPVTKFRSAKGRALLAYLAAEADQPHLRTSLAALLWGNYPETAAKTNLRVELSQLKKSLQNHVALELNRQSVRLNSQDTSIDVISFQQKVDAFLTRPSESQSRYLDDLEEAIALYRGDFLAGFYLEGAADFEDWQRLEQEKLHDQAMQALTLLQQHYLEQGNWEALERAARRQLTLTSWLEAAHLNLMQALAAQGQPQAALAQFAKCRTILQAELGVTGFSDPRIGAQVGAGAFLYPIQPAQPASPAKGLDRPAG